MGSIPFLSFHVFFVVAAILTPFRWEWAALAVASYYVRMFFVTATYHRYFSHRSFKLSRAAQFIFAFIAQTSVQKGVLWWAAHHRHHHRFSDQPEDLHSPKQDGFWWSHVGWILARKNGETHWDQIQDFAKFPELVWLNRHYIVPVVAYAIPFALWGWGAFVWGFGIGTILLWHGTFTINSLSHVFGWQRYKTTDTSRNNPLLAVITCGEGWHNNHHRYMSSVRQGFYWWEYDFTYWGLKALSWVGIVRDMRKPPMELLEQSKVGVAGSGAAPVATVSESEAFQKTKRPGNLA